MDKKSQAMRAAMEELKNMPCGAIGTDGPTIEDLDEYNENTGKIFEDDAVYHVSQRVWRILEEGLKEE